MALSSEEIIELSLDASLGRTSRLTTPEAKAFLAKQKAYIEKVKKAGGVVEIPFEHPDLEDD